MTDRQWSSSKSHRIVLSKHSIFLSIPSSIPSCHWKASMINFKWSTMKATLPKRTITIGHRVSWPISREKVIHSGNSLGVKIFTRRYFRMITGNSLGNKNSLKESVQNVNSPAIVQQWIKEHYCVPEAMNLVIISNGKKRIQRSAALLVICLGRIVSGDATTCGTIVLSDETQVTNLLRAWS